MKKQEPVEPERYLPSKAHPGYSKEEFNYVISHVVPKEVKKMRASDGGKRPAGALVECYTNEIRHGWKAIPGLGPSFSEDKDKLVVEAMMLFREPMFLAASLVPMQLSKEANQLAGAVCHVLGHLQSQIVFGDAGRRRNAARRLRKILADIIPETRGKKRATAHPLEAKIFYYKELFRLYHIQHALRGPGKNQSAKVKAASQEFDMPIQQLRDLWQLDEDEEVRARRISIKEMARILTGRHFRITQHRLSNILAS
jgi:hypothetical protein